MAHHNYDVNLLSCKVTRHRRDFQPHSNQEGQGMAKHTCLDTLAREQEHVCPPSICLTIGWLASFKQLLCLGIACRDWCTLLPICVGGAAWRLCPKWWHAYSRLVWTGQFAGRGVGSRKLCQPTPIADVLSSWPRERAVSFAQSAVKAVTAVGREIHMLAEIFDKEVLRSHGSHLPVRVLDDVTLAFWLPELLFGTPQQLSGLATGPMNRDWLRHVLESRSEALQFPYKYLYCRMGFFEWPPFEDVQKQYVRMLTISIMEGSNLS